MTRINECSVQTALFITAYSLLCHTQQKERGPRPLGNNWKWCGRSVNT